MSARSPWGRITLLILVLCLTVGGLLWYFLPWRARPKTFADIGGTRLVFEIDEEALARSGQGRDGLADRVQGVLDPHGVRGLEVRLAAGSRLEVAVPRGKFHDIAVEYVKELLGTAGSFELRILANKSDDHEAAQVATWYFERGSEEWKAVVAEVAQKWPAPESRRGLYTGLDFDDLDGLVARATQEASGTPEKEVRAFVSSCYSRRPRLAELSRRARMGEPPPPPQPSSPEGFVVPNEGSRGATYSWVRLAEEERESLQLLPDQAGPQEWQAAEDARRKGLSFLHPRFHPPSLFYARRAWTGDDPVEIFVLSRHPRKGKEITGAVVTRFSDGLDARDQSAVDFALTPAGGDLLHELTSQNQPEEDGRLQRHLAILLDGEVLSAPTLNAVIREHGQITGRYTEDEVKQLVRLLRAGALSGIVKPEPVAEEVVDPAGR